MFRLIALHRSTAGFFVSWIVPLIMLNVTVADHGNGPTPPKTHVAEPHVAEAHAPQAQAAQAAPLPLVAERVAVLAAKGNADSEGLARRYMTARSIPESNLLLLEVDNEERVTRENWEKSLRPRIVAWLNEKEDRRNLTCLVTMRGIPLVIDAQSPETPDPFRDFLLSERRTRERKTLESLNALRKLGTAETVNNADIRDGVTDRTLAEWQLEFEAAATEAQQRLQSLTGTKRDDAARVFENLVTVLAGANLLLANLNNQASGGAASEKIKSDFQFIRGRVVTLQESINLTSQLPPSVIGDTYNLAYLERLVGLVGTLGWIDEQLELVARNETAAALDNELAIIHWADPSYRLHRWQPNFLNAGYRDLTIATAYPTMMVARIDGPTWEVCQRMIDVPIAVEQAGGLQGTVYLDSRGLARQGDVSPESQLDADLVQTGRRLDAEFGLDVVVDETPGLFEAGSCPDAALYCGGYSLAKYVDAFEFNPGAIGYPLSTVEAMGLHDSVNSAWCHQLLLDGVVATVGAVDESGWAALPRPQQLFGRLIGDHATLGEAFWSAQPYTSWQIILLGDPLYRPFPPATDSRPAGQ